LWRRLFFDEAWHAALQGEGGVPLPPQWLFFDALLYFKGSVGPLAHLPFDDPSAANRWPQFAKPAVSS
jgi:hypothetical protein